MDKKNESKYEIEYEENTNRFQTYVKNRKTLKSTSRKIWKSLIIVLLIFFIIVVFISIALFFITMPSMVIDKVNEYSKSLGKQISNWFGISTSEIEEIEMYEIINYFENMGYDLKSYGFLTQYYNDDFDNDGVLRNEESKIIKAESDFLYTYLIADNSVYSVKTGKGEKEDFWSSVSGLSENFVEFIQEDWNEGLVGIYKDSGKYGIKEQTYVNSGFDSSDVKLDFENDILSIKKTTYDDKAVQKYKINGWNGKYSKPLELLLSLHISTLMPDLSYELATKFQTEIAILLHPLETTPSIYYSIDGTSYMDRNQVSTSYHAQVCDCTQGVRGSICQAEANEIISVMDQAANNSFGAYAPYIAYVTNHWYRDIYWVANSNDTKFIKYDDEYQDIVNERWTLYDEDTAQTINISQEAEEIGWNQYGGVWTAYLEKKGSSSNYIQAYSNAAEGSIQSKIYWKVVTNKNIAQTGDGQRIETNSTIKKIFQDNYYFRYDGTPDRAEVITALREKYNIPYGALSEEVLNNTYTLEDEEGNIQEYNIKDYVGKVSIGQDSLNAFSMLENTHTLDADYVYRDFKELIVELGYYEKEELTDETPKLLQWIVPSIGSYGYPKRELDKNENEFGTMIHSKQDLEAYVTEAEKGENEQKVSEVAIVENFEEIEKQVEEIVGIGDDTSSIENLADEQEFKPTQEVKSQFVSSYNGKKTSDIIQQEIEGSHGHAKINNTNQGYVFAAHGVDNAVDYIISLGGIFEKYGKMYKDGTKIEVTTVQEFQEISEYVFGIMVLYGFDYCANCPVGHERHTYFRLSDTPSGTYSYNVNNQKKANPGKIIEKAISNNIANVCCNWGVDLAYFKMGLFGNKGQPRSSCNMTNLMNCGGQEVTMVEDLQVGDIIQCFNNTITDYSVFGEKKRNTYDWFHVCYVGEVNKEEGYLVLYDSGHYFTNSGNYKNKIYYDKTDGTFLQGDSEHGNAKWVGIHLFDLDGGANKEYEGYEGNEAVVSPVTGVLLEYGTYNSRENVDLKYGKCDINNTDTEAKNVIKDNLEDVGYAKILVLDEENYQKLELTLENRWKNNSLLNSNGNYIEEATLKSKDDLEKWNQNDKTVYGYKEFAESYEEAGIEGNIIYIEGFACEEPGKEKDDGTVESMQNFSMEYFIEMAQNKEKKLQNSYKADSVYKLSTQKYTEKSEAESKVKEMASQAVYLDEGILLIKEGTVLGRTFTDEEVYARRNEEYKSMIKLNEEGRAQNLGNKNVVQGNYLKIIMTEENGEIIENIENYIKLQTTEPRKIIRKFAITKDELAFMAGVMQAEAGNSDEELTAMAWLIRNRLVSGRFDEMLSIGDILIGFNSVNTKNNGISIEVDNKKYYVSSPTEKAKEIAEKVLKGEIENPIGDRCYKTNNQDEISENDEPIKIGKNIYY